MAKKAEAPLLKDPTVRELLAVLEQNNAPGKQDLLAMLQQIAGMEKQLVAAVEELAAMRKELAEAQKQNHPVKTAMQKTVIVMQGQVLDLRDKLTDLKQAVVEGCKLALADFKVKGITARENISRFFKVKPLLENVRDSLTHSIAQDDQAIARIEAVSKEYHGAGLHLKNLARVMRGQEPVAEPKGPGGRARALEAPFKAERALLSSIKDRAAGALKSLERLEEARPPIRKTMEKMGAKVAAQRDKSAPAVQRNER